MYAQRYVYMNMKSYDVSVVWKKSASELFVMKIVVKSKVSFFVHACRQSTSSSWSEQ